MALRLRNRPTLAKSPFEKLILDAVAETKLVDKLQAASAHRLTADALIKEALKAGRTSRKRMERLRRKLESSPNVAHSQATLRRFTTAIGLGHWSSGVNIQRLGTLSTEGTNNELAREGFSLVELFCLAIERAADAHPDAFGEAESPTQVRGDAEQAQQRQQELFRRISTSFTPADLDTEVLDYRGFPIVALKFAGLRTNIAPLESLGERVVRAYMAKQPTNT
jgi:hypothetical protein